MTELDGALVRRKLSSITRNLQYLKDVAGLSLDEYTRDRFRLKGTERMLQEVVEAAVDVNVHLLRALGCPTPADYHQSFVQMGAQGILSSELAALLAPSAGLRNRLVHEYDDIDNAKVLESLSVALRQYHDYIAVIETWLSGRGV